MSLGRLRAQTRPFHEEEEGAPSPGGLAGGFDEHLDAVRKAVAPLERGGAVVHSRVPADRRLVTLRVIRWAVPRVRHQDFLLPNISRTTLPVMNATFAGRSAKRL